MKVKAIFSDSETKVSDFDSYLRLFEKAVSVFLKLSPFERMDVEILKECSCHETQKEKACNKGVCKQRRNKTVNACKPS